MTHIMASFTDRSGKSDGSDDILFDGCGTVDDFRRAIVIDGGWGPLPPVLAAPQESTYPCSPTVLGEEGMTCVY